MTESGGIRGGLTPDAPVTYGDWVAAPERRTDVVRAGAITNLRDLLDRPGPLPKTLPLLWHWLAFTPQGRQADLGPDGHPRTGAFLPPMAGRSRMFAGATVTRRGSISVNEPLVRVSTVTGVAPKIGRSGHMLFVTVEHVVTGPRGAVEEVDTIVYREPGGAVSAHESDVTGWAWRRPVVMDPTMLFRYSALTYNAHRIHYDRAYATQAEGYPGLVVHGPLQAVLLADLAERHSAGASLSSITFRATAPAFDTGAFDVCGNPAPDHLDLAVHSDGVTTMVATVTVEEFREPI